MRTSLETSYRQVSLTLSTPAPHSYPIIIGAGVLNNAELLRQKIDSRQVCVVSNTAIAALYLDTLQAALGDCQLISVMLPEGEQFKTLAQVSEILDALVANRFNRDAMVVALGGGVVGDVAGFAAACYQRGVNLVQIPTSLLAQVDSSVGGKTGVNHAQGKNLIGAFYQPQAVFIDTNTLRSLPAREFSAGMAEVIKYGLIGDAAFIDWLEAHIAEIVALDSALLEEMIARCCQHKAEIVARDEKESGQRALLNLGHTFGHALEALGAYQRFKHGEAVAIGMMMALELAESEGRVSLAQVARIERLLQAVSLPVQFEGFETDAIVQAMGLDKKVRAGKLRLIVPTALGACEIRDGIALESIRAAIERRRRA